VNELPLVVAGDSPALMVVVVVVADSGEDAGLAAGATVSVFCSQAASNAAAAKMEKEFLIIR
jgi:hypothetical protein